MAAAVADPGAAKAEKNEPADAFINFSDNPCLRRKSRKWLAIP
jgi:hypothetical protein